MRYIAPTHAVSKSPIKQPSTPPTHHIEGSHSAAKLRPAKSTKAIPNLIVIRKLIISSHPQKSVDIVILLTLRRATSTRGRPGTLHPPDDSSRDAPCITPNPVSGSVSQGREDPARFAGCRIILRTEGGIIRESALRKLCLCRHTFHDCALHAFLDQAEEEHTVAAVIGGHPPPAPTRITRSGNRRE